MPKKYTPGHWVQVDWTCSNCGKADVAATGTVYAGVGGIEHECPNCKSRVNLIEAYPFTEWVLDGQEPSAD